MKRREKLTFNLADRDKHIESLKQLYGDGNVEKKTDRQEADTRLESADSDSERVSRVQGVLGIRPDGSAIAKVPHKTRQ